MNPLVLALAYLRDRPAATLLNVMLAALGVLSATALMLLVVQLDQRRAVDGENIDIVMGAPGSRLQLVLSSVHHADVPVGNIALSEAEFVATHPLVDRATPLAQGDNYNGVRIVGTTPDYLELYGAEVVQGAFWDAPLQAVLGASAAQSLGLELGDSFESSHGVGDSGIEHSHAPLEVVGVLSPTGAVIDRLILTSLDTMWIAHGEGHDHDHGDHDHGDHDHGDHDHGDHEHGDHEHGDHEHGDVDGEEHGHVDEHDARSASVAVDGELVRDDTASEPDGVRSPWALTAGPADREITALLISLDDDGGEVLVQNAIEQRTSAMAARPAVELLRITEQFGFGFEIVRGFAWLLVGAAGLGIFVSLMGQMRERQADIALMRVMGASRVRVFVQVMLEGALVAGVGAALGLAAAHLGVDVVAQRLDQLRDAGVTGWVFLPQELVVLAFAFGVGIVGALIPAVWAYRVDLAKTVTR